MRGRSEVRGVGSLVSAKRRGVNFEYRCAYLFERFGYSWDRSGSSLGIDLKIIKDGKLRYLVSCKKTSQLGPIYLPKFEVEQLAEKARRFAVQGLICFGFRRTPVLVATLDEVRRLESKRLSYKLRPGDGRPLMEFLTGQLPTGAKNRGRVRDLKAGGF